MENQNPLDIKKIKELLKTKTDGSLYKRESTTLEFKADFTHVKIVKSSFVTVNKLKSDTEHAADKVDAGKKTPKDLNKDKEDAKKASLLAKMYKHVSGISQEARLSE